MKFKTELIFMKDGERNRHRLIEERLPELQKGELVIVEGVRYKVQDKYTDIAIEIVDEPSCTVVYFLEEF